MAYGLNTQSRRPRISSLVMFEFTSTQEELEGPTWALLWKELAKKGTPVYQYNVSSRDLWLEGAPGPDLRALMEKVKLLGWMPKGRGT